MFTFTITTVELIGWIIIYMVGLICVALGLGCVIHGERQKRFWMQHQLDDMIESVGTLQQRILDLESQAMWIDKFGHSEDRSFPNEKSQLRKYVDYLAENGTPIVGNPIADATVGTVMVAESQLFVYNGNSWASISLPDEIEDASVTKVIPASDLNRS